MDFKLSEEQQMLQDTAARLVRDAYPFDKREGFSHSELGYSAEFWRQLGELGLTSVSLPESHGGFGGGVESLLVLTELGRGLCLEPYLQSVVHGGGLIAQLGSEAQQDHWLPRIASAEAQLAVALEEPQSHYQLHDVQTRAEQAGDGWKLSGRKAVVIGGQSATAILVSARVTGNARDEAGIGLFLVDPQQAGVSRRDYPTVDGQRACELFLDGAVGEAVGTPGEALPALRYQQGRAIAAQCAEALGSLQEGCALTLDYLKTRKQFGVPIGKFQVLQHRMVDCFTNAQEARSMTLMASLKIDDKDPTVRAKAASGAKVQIGKSGKFCGQSAVQMHGGMGVTDELSVSHYFKRLTMIDLMFGNQQHHLTRYSNLAMAA